MTCPNCGDAGWRDTGVVNAGVRLFIACRCTTPYLRYDWRKPEPKEHSDGVSESTGMAHGSSSDTAPGAGEVPGDPGCCP